MIKKKLVIMFSLLLVCGALAAVRIFYQQFSLEISEGLRAEVLVSEKASCSGQWMKQSAKPISIKANPGEFRRICVKVTNVGSGPVTYTVALIGNLSQITGEKFNFIRAVGGRSTDNSYIDFNVNGNASVGKFDLFLDVGRG